jgi:hypothetical protein
MVEPMSTQITPEAITNALTDYDPENCTDAITLDADVFQELALIAHDMDITVNALVNAIFHITVAEAGLDDLPSIPGVGTAPYMAELS